jgi:hypothetical protein
MLEDDFTYVLRKSLMGHGIAPAQAAQRAGVPENDVLAFLRGTFSAETARKLAPVLRCRMRPSCSPATARPPRSARNGPPIHSSNGVAVYKRHETQRLSGRPKLHLGLLVEWQGAHHSCR